MAPRLLVVQNDVDKSLGRIASALLEAGAELDVHISTGELPGIDGYDGLVSLPGLADPDDDTPEVHRVREVTRAALARGVPVLGICLGGQLLVQAQGGETYRSENEVGFRDVVRTPEGATDELLRDVPDRFSTLHAHCYGFTPPPGAVVLLENDVCVQACRLGNTWAFQCHPEATAEWIEGVALGLRGVTSAIDPRTVRFFRSNGVDPDTLERMAREAHDTSDLLAQGIARGFAAAARADGAMRDRADASAPQRVQDRV